MLTRDWSATPEPYKGIRMRSKLERHVAEFMDTLAISWEYETPVVKDGKQVKYLPDFKIVGDYPDLGLADAERPRCEGSSWVEVKPQEFIYALRDHLGVPERSQDKVTIPVSAHDLVDAGIEELWKPKRLAELMNRQVLIVGAVNRDRTLSVRMNAYGATFETDHPLVNYRGVTRAKAKQEQREIREAEWQRQAEERQAAAEAERAEMLEAFGRFVRNAKRINSRYDGYCRWCRQDQPAHLLYAFKAEDRWVAICRTCTKQIESAT